MDSFILRTFADNPADAKAANVIVDAAWRGMSFLNFTKSHYEYYWALMERYQDHQLCLVDGERQYVIAAANTVPLYTPDPFDLPQTGWDWVLKTAYDTMDREPNVLCGVAISVSPAYRGQGIAPRMIQGMRDLCREKQLQRLILPVRPSAKYKFPQVPIEEYIRWTDAQGRIFDPWLRSHVSMGGRVQGVCYSSMVVEEPVGFWEAWLGQRIEASGDFEIENGLVPVKIDLEQNVGRYAEPNVWIAYPGVEAAAAGAAYSGATTAARVAA